MKIEVARISSVPAGLGILQTEVAAWLSFDQRRETREGRRLLHEIRINDSSENRGDEATEEFGELQDRDSNCRPPKHKNEEAPTGEGNNKRARTTKTSTRIKSKN